jgi:hypothetical protein
MKNESQKNLLIRMIVSKGYRIENEKIISPNGTVRKLGLNDGYPVLGVKLPKTRRVISIKVHRIVAFMKYGEEAFGCETVRHKNGIKTDFSWDNILIGTQSENMMDRDSNARIAHAKLASSYNIKYGTEICDKIRELRERGFGYGRIGKELNIPKSSVRYIIMSERYFQVS